MKQEIAVEWVKNLRSGKYKQTTNGALKDDIGFCCLGVLCDMSAEAGQGQWLDFVGQSKSFRCSSAPDSSSTILPEPVQDWAGMRDATGDLGELEYICVENRAFANLTEANDDGLSFSNIADYIEKNWEKF